MPMNSPLLAWRKLPLFIAPKQTVREGPLVHGA
jgi:hypothetical protein